jgi:WD40 repeat protein
MDYRFGKNFQLNDYVTSLVWSQDATKLAFGLSEGEIGVIDVKQEIILCRWKTEDNGTLKVAFLNNKTLLSAGQDGKIKIWNIENQQLIKEEKGGGMWVEHLAVNYKKNIFASASGKFVKVFDFEGNVIEQITQKSTISHIEWAKDGSQLAVIFYGGAIFYDFAKDWKEEMLYKSSFISGALSPNGKFLAAGTQDNKIHFWLLPYLPESDLEMAGYPLKVKTLSWSENSQYLATPSVDALIIWDTSSGSPQGKTPHQLPGHKGKVTQVAFQPNGFLLASTDESGKLLLWGYPLLLEPFFDRQMKTKEVTNLVWAEKEFWLAFSTAEGLVQYMEIKLTQPEKTAFVNKIYS